MESFNCEKLFEYKDSLVTYMEERLKEIDKVKILGETNSRKGALAFVVKGIHSYDIAKMLDKYGIAARSGHNCEQPYLNALGYENACRVSLTFYNKYNEIDYFIDKLQNIIKIYEKVM